jgi:tetratricopeptide (TPR) repeat protein
MYELALILGLGFLAFRSTKDEEAEVEVHRFGDKVGKLWDIVHQGMRENRLLRAEKALLTILRIDEKNAAAYNRLGILYAKQKGFKDAIDCFEIACSIESTASSLHNLGLIYYETENYEKSIAAFEEALRLEDGLAARHIALAKALERSGNHKAMLERLERAVEIEPNQQTYGILARGYHSMGMEDKASLIEDKLKRLIIPAGQKQKQRIKRRKRVVV